MRVAATDLGQRFKRLRTTDGAVQFQTKLAVRTEIQLQQQHKVLRSPLCAALTARRAFQFPDWNIWFENRLESWSKVKLYRPAIARTIRLGPAGWTNQSNE